MRCLFLSPWDSSRQCTTKLRAWFRCLANGPCRTTGIPDLREAQAPVPRRSVQRLQPSELWNDYRSGYFPELLQPNYGSRLHLGSSYWNLGAGLRRSKPAVPNGRTSVDAVRSETTILTGKFSGFPAGDIF